MYVELCTVQHNHVVSNGSRQPSRFFRGQIHGVNIFWREIRGLSPPGEQDLRECPLCREKFPTVCWAQTDVVEDRLEIR